MKLSPLALAALATGPMVVVQAFDSEILNIVMGVETRRLSTTLHTVAGERKLDGDDEDDDDDDDDEEFCPSLICGGGGLSENLIAQRFDGAEPDFELPLDTTTPISFKDCADFCKDVADDTEFEEAYYVSYFDLVGFDTTACFCSSACTFIADFSLIDPNNDQNAFFIPSEEEFGEIGDDLSCADIEVVLQEPFVPPTTTAP